MRKILDFFLKVLALQFYYPYVCNSKQKNKLYEKIDSRSFSC